MLSASQTDASASGFATIGNASKSISLNQGDIVTLYAWQNSGGSLTFAGSLSMIEIPDV